MQNQTDWNSKTLQNVTHIRNNWIALAGRWGKRKRIARGDEGESMSINEQLTSHPLNSMLDAIQSLSEWMTVSQYSHVEGESSWLLLWVTSFCFTTFEIQLISYEKSRINCIIIQRKAKIKIGSLINKVSWKPVPMYCVRLLHVSPHDFRHISRRYCFNGCFFFSRSHRNSSQMCRNSIHCVYSGLGPSRWFIIVCLGSILVAVVVVVIIVKFISHSNETKSHQCG